jgi:hypothetical protein
MLNDKYMCPDSCGKSCGGAGWHYFAYWSCVSWATWQKVGHSALLHKGTPTPDCMLGNYKFYYTKALRLGAEMYGWCKDKWKGVQSQDPTAP